MPFTSFNFYLIFPIIFALYRLIPAKYNQEKKVLLVPVSMGLKPYKKLATLHSPLTLNTQF